MAHDIRQFSYTQLAAWAAMFEATAQIEDDPVKAVKYMEKAVSYGEAMLENLQAKLARHRAMADSSDSPGQ